MINKNYLIGFINKFNFGKDLLENVQIEVNSMGNRVHCVTEDRSMYLDIHTHEFIFEKEFILPDIDRFLRYLSVFDKEFEYDLPIDEQSAEAFELILFDKITKFNYGLGDDVLLMNIKHNLPDKLPMMDDDITIVIDEKKANAILNSLKLTNADFVTIKANKDSMAIKIGDEEIKEPIVEMALEGSINNVDTEVSSRYSLVNFRTVLSVNKVCTIKVKFGKEKSSGMIIMADDADYECIYGFNPLVERKVV